jgi:hypothetical protein
LKLNKNCRGRVRLAHPKNKKALPPTFFPLEIFMHTTNRRLIEALTKATVSRISFCGRFSVFRLHYVFVWSEARSVMKYVVGCWCAWHTRKIKKPCRPLFFPRNFHARNRRLIEALTKANCVPDLPLWEVFGVPLTLCLSLVRSTERFEA